MQLPFFQHKDLYLCAYLIVLNCKLIKHERTGNSTTFTFQYSPELSQYVSDFYSMNGAVEPMAYSAVIRNLKTMVHSNRSSGDTLSTRSNQGLNNEFNNKQKVNN